MSNVIINNKSFSLAIGDDFQTHFIAEIGLNHNGSFELAKNLIFEAAKSGATIVKFQKREPDKLATPEFLDAPFTKCSSFGLTQRDVRNRLELNFDQYKKLSEISGDLGMLFCVSVFDIYSLEFVCKLSNPIIKVASHSLTNGRLLRAVANTKLPVFCSVGASDEREIDFAVSILNSSTLVLFHCVSQYPTEDSNSYLDTINYLKDKYNVPVGFSSHEKGIDISIASTLLGACALERHFTFNKSMAGLDHGISLNPKEFAKMVKKVKRLEKVRGIKKIIFPNELLARNNYHVGLYAKNDINVGQKVTNDDLICLQPLNSSDKFFTGLEIESIIGKKLDKKLSKGEQLSRLHIK